MPTFVPRTFVSLVIFFFLPIPALSKRTITHDVGSYLITNKLPWLFSRQQFVEEEESWLGVDCLAKLE